MYYNEELGREQSATEVVADITVAVVVFAAAWSFLTWATV